MDDYPSIARDVVDVDIYAFDKIDGSQIRAEWGPKKGFWKFGTRTHLTDENDEQWGDAVKSVKLLYADPLHEIFKGERFQKVIAFFEYWGPSSFAGNHAKDEIHIVTLFDFRVYKKGILPPNEFIRLTRDKIVTAGLLYHGKANQLFVEQVKTGKLEGMTFEGVETVD